MHCNYGFSGIAHFYNNDDNLYLETMEGDRFTFPINLLMYAPRLEFIYRQGQGGVNSPIRVQCEANVVGAVISDLERNVTRGRVIDTQRYDDDVLRKLITCANSLDIRLVRDVYQAAWDARQQPVPPAINPVYAALGLGTNNPTPYQILGLPEGASRRDVTRAYYRLSRVWHPDRNQNNPLALQVFQALQGAYESIVGGAEFIPQW